jgi:hypothetical protein
LWFSGGLRILVAQQPKVEKLAGCEGCCGDFQYPSSIDGPRSERISLGILARSLAWALVVLLYMPDDGAARQAADSQALEGPAEW